MGWPALKKIPGSAEIVANTRVPASACKPAEERVGSGTDPPPTSHLPGGRRAGEGVMTLTSHAGREGARRQKGRCGASHHPPANRGAPFLPGGRRAGVGLTTTHRPTIPARRQKGGEGLRTRTSQQEQDSRRGARNTLGCREAGCRTAVRAVWGSKLPHPQESTSGTPRGWKHPRLLIRRRAASVDAEGLDAPSAAGRHDG